MMVPMGRSGNPGRRVVQAAESERRREASADWRNNPRVETLAPVQDVLQAVGTYRTDEALGRLVRRAHEVEVAQSMLAAEVRRGRNLGLSWSEIGRALGLTGEGARRRYGAS